MSDGEGRHHPSEGPLVKWIGAGAGLLLALMGLFDSGASRVAVLMLGVLVGVTA